MSVNLTVGSPDVPYPLHGVLSQTGLDWTRVGNIRLAFAYVTYAGLRSLITGLEEAGHDLETVRTEWIAGLDRGVTEPRALSQILRLRGARLRLFVPGGRVNRGTLLSKPKLHSKVIAVEGTDGNLIALQAGSANLTGAAIGTRAQNYEAGFLVSLPATSLAQHQAAFRRWWAEVGRHGINATEQIIKQYADIREPFLRQSRKVLDILDIDLPVSEDIANARFFWIEAGEMSGGNVPAYRYQTELTGDMANFFGARRPSVQFELVMPAGEVGSGRLTLRKEHHYVPLWRMGLPNPRRFGIQYRQNVLRFERVGDGRFQLRIAPPGGTEAARWRRAASRDGHLNHTGGMQGRDWGFYS